MVPALHLHASETTFPASATREIPNWPRDIRNAEPRFWSACLAEIAEVE